MTYADIDNAILRAFKDAGWTANNAWVYYDAIVRMASQRLSEYKSRRTIERRIRKLASKDYDLLEGNGKGHFRMVVRA